MRFKDRIEQHIIEIKQPPAKFSVQKINNEHRLSVNGQVIWTLSENEYTENVLKAIMHTYFIGVRDIHILFDAT